MENYYLFYYQLNFLYSNGTPQTDSILLKDFLKKKLGLNNEIKIIGEANKYIFLDPDKNFFTFYRNKKLQNKKFNVEIEPNNGGKLRFFMKFKLKSSQENLTQVNEFVDFFQKSIEDKNQLQIAEKHQDQAYRFLRPHIVGVNKDLERIRSFIQVTYKRVDNKIQLSGKITRDLLRFATQRQYEYHTPSPQLKVRFQNGSENHLLWKSDTHEWILQDINNIVPTIGNLLIFFDLNESEIPFLFHDHKKLLKMRKSLYLLKDDPLLPGTKLFQEMVSDKEIFINNCNKFYKICDFSNLKDLLEHFDLSDHFGYLDDDQRKAIWKGLTQRMLILTGKAGTGKTEVGSIIMLILILLGKRILISTQTNEAVDSFLDRINNHLNNIPKYSRNIEMVRMEGINHYFKNKELNKYSINEIIHHMKITIKNELENNPKIISNELKERLTNFSSDNKHLKEIVSTMFDSVNCTFGVIGQRNFFNQNHNSFDLFITEGSSLVNFSMFCMGALFSHKWIIIGDKDQLNPITPGMLLPRQPLRLPLQKEKNCAENFDSFQLYRIKVPEFNKSKYKSNIITLLGNMIGIPNDYSENEKDCNPELMIHQDLKIQYRTEKSLHRKVCEIFNYPVNLPDEIHYHPEHFLLLNNHHLNFLIDNPEHQRMYFFKSNEIHLTDKVRDLISQIININPSEQISVGIMFHNVISLMRVMKQFDENSINIITQNYDSNENIFKTSKYITINNINLAFSSIRSHEEKQYDIIIMGMTKEFYSSKRFKETLYTALSRAKSYIFLVGPTIKLHKKSHNNEIYMKLLKEGGINNNRRSI